MSELEIDGFLASNGWLDRWKNRYGIVYKKAHGEKVDADVSAADQWISTTLLDVLLRYTPDDVYNANETSLYWHALPNGSHVFKEGQLSAGKIAKDCITVLVTV